MINLLKRRLIHRSLRDTRGGVMIEFGFAMPILIMLMLGGIEIGRFVLLHQKLDRTAMTVSDLVARLQSINTAEIDTIFTAASLVMSPFDLNERGVVVISSVKEVSNNPKVIWQRSGAGTLTVTSELGIQGANAVISDNGLVNTQDGIIVGETYFEYEPWFIKLLPSKRIRHMAIFRPRLSAEVLCTDCP